jgi:hypothetical protein
MTVQHLIIGCIVLLAGNLRAAAQIEVYSDPANKLDTTLSFGATRPFTSVSRTVTVRNASPADVRIRPSITDLNGMFTSVIGEFAGAFSTEIIPAGQTKVYTVLYKADFVSFPVDSLAQVRFVIDVDDPQTQRALLKHVFVFSGVKTNRLVATDQRVVSFDSVFINPACKTSGTVTFYGVTNGNVSVLEQRVRRVTPFVGTDEINVQRYPAVEFAGVNSISWNCTYEPVNLGRDAVEFAVRYTNPADASDTAAAVFIEGYGVAQRCEPLGIRTSDGKDLVGAIRGDTLNVGILPISVDSLRFAVTFRNTGNISLGIDSVAFASEAPVADEWVVRRLPKLWLPANAVDTIHLVFRPGPSTSISTARLRFYTNLGRRSISCVPDATIIQEFVVTAGKQQPVEANESELRFGAVVRSADCESVVSKTIILRNNSSASCIIDSATVEPANSGMRVLRATNVVIAPSGTAILDCELRALRSGQQYGTVTFWIDGARRSLRVPFSADVVDPDTLLLSVAGDVRARPGSVIDVAVRSTPSMMRSVKRVVCSLAVNTSLLGFVRVVESGTASEGALVRIQEHQGGCIVSIEQDAGLQLRDTLVVLQFKAFLGDSASTAIEVHPVSTMGTGACPAAFPLQRIHGRFALDSLCGLSYKTLSDAAGLRGSVFPSPANDHATLVVGAVTSATASIEIVDAFGRTWASLESALGTGLTTIPIPVSPLPSGQYMIVVQSGGFLVRVPMVVSQ